MILSTDLKGNKYTRRGLQQEAVTIQDYVNWKKIKLRNAV